MARLLDIYLVQSIRQKLWYSNCFPILRWRLDSGFWQQVKILCKVGEDTPRYTVTTEPSGYRTGGNDWWFDWSWNIFNPTPSIAPSPLSNDNDNESPRYAAVSWISSFSIKRGRLELPRSPTFNMKPLEKSSLSGYRSPVTRLRNDSTATPSSTSYISALMRSTSITVSPAAKEVNITMYWSHAIEQSRVQTWASCSQKSNQ